MNASHRKLIPRFFALLRLCRAVFCLAKRQQTAVRRAVCNPKERAPKSRCGEEVVAALRKQSSITLVSDESSADLILEAAAERFG